VIRVLIADDEPLIRAGIRAILTAADGIEVVAGASSGQEAIDLAATHRVDVAMLDIQMPGMDGLTALEQLQYTAPATRTLILTTFGERTNVLRAFNSGSAGFLLKDAPPADLIQAVRAAATGQAFLSPSAARHLVDTVAATPTTAHTEEARRRLDVLTPRETDVLTLLGEGLSNADLGARIHMTEASVKTYVSRILTKLDCDNRVQAALLAHHAGLAGP
jgi:DNA-binding NarL/FixJ family response regulator